MPELPEVEYNRRRLERWVRGSRIVEACTEDERIVRPASPRSFAKRVSGRVVVEIERRGKWLRWLLDDDQRIFIHLGMTGWFERERRADPANPHPAAGGHLRFERVRFVIDRRGVVSAVVYVDPRRWGRIIVARGDIASWSSLGDDPLADGIDVSRLAAKLARRKGRSIKEALMDQTILAGIGNIQAIEALWKAGIDPRSRASAIDRADLGKLARALRWTIARTLADLERRGPRPDNPFRIYGRKGEPCPRCRTPLDRFELGGRTTTFCPGCQRRTRRISPRAGSRSRSR